MTSPDVVATQAHLWYLEEGSMPGHEEQPGLETDVDSFIRIVRETEIPPHHWLLAFVDEGSALTRRYYG